MKRALLCLVMMMSVSFVFAQKKKSDEKLSKVISSEINWWGYKIFKAEPTTYTGSLKLKSGVFRFKDGKFDGGDFVIDMRNLLVKTDMNSSDLAKLTTELKGFTFFDVKKYPIAKFELTKILPLSNGSEYNSSVYGNLTLKGIRKTISFPATVNITGTSVSIQSAKFPLNRQVFNVFYKSSIKDYIIKDEMDVQFKVATK